MGIIIKIIFFALITLFINTGLFTRPNADRWTLYFENIKGTEVPIYCEVADSLKEKERGLMFRNELPDDECMIFVYKSSTLLRFWMKNTNIPLSIAFLNKDFVINEIYPMTPGDESIITSTTTARYAVEANMGWFRKNLIFPGNRAIVVKKDVRKK